MRMAVLGAGAWGTAFAKLLVDAGHDVALCARDAALAASIGRERRNPRYLPGVVLPSALRTTADPAEAVAAADVVLLAVPAQHLRASLTGWAPLLPPEAALVSLAKGIELGTCKRMSEVITEVSGRPLAQVAVVSGPNLAPEIAAEHPAASVVACVDSDRAAWLQTAFQTPYFRPYSNTDIVGCELGGAVKNVIALAAGMAEGMGFGDNTKASLLTRGLAEMARLGAALGAEPGTFAGLAGLGDLVATCGSPLSRNRVLGERLGRGETLAEAVADSRGTAEGCRPAGRCWRSLSGSECRCRSPRVWCGSATGGSGRGRWSRR